MSCLEEPRPGSRAWPSGPSLAPWPGLQIRPVLPAAGPAAGSISTGRRAKKRLFVVLDQGLNLCRLAKEMATE